MTIETQFDSNYRKVLVAARRARQLQSGSHALVSTQSNKACRIAQDEINAGKIAYVKTATRCTSRWSKARRFPFCSARRTPPG
jgi:DNA-directed RNA polymerase subunit omega